ncbi:MAG: hypothetical protein GX349_07075 [Firmicutes bacterium]|nr:hypothetical protein [Bacillota bacterium]
MRGFWQGVLIGGITGMALGLMSAPLMLREMGGKGEQGISSAAKRAFRGVQENIGEMWQKRVKE